ncbi:MAG: preprotein translocase subunit Sec61beta [Nanoarchaeota archaeon]|nr:preprotein translocase subunit Sec61beta [Nanoarchaeota archaeon]
MAQDNKISMPSGFGGLMRFDEEFKSKFMITPMHVIGMVVSIIAFRVFLWFWFK